MGRRVHVRLPRERSGNLSLVVTRIGHTHRVGIRDAFPLVLAGLSLSSCGARTGLEPGEASGRADATSNGLDATGIAPDAEPDGEDAGAQDGGFLVTNAGSAGPCVYATLGDDGACVSAEVFIRYVLTNFEGQNCTIIPGPQCVGPAVNNVTQAFYFCCPAFCTFLGDGPGPCTSPDAAYDEIQSFCPPNLKAIVVDSPFDPCEGGVSNGGAGCCP